MRRHWFIAVSLLFAFSFISLNTVSSQSGQSGQSGMITGTVKDPNGAAVAGAQVITSRCWFPSTWISAERSRVSAPSQ
jgi:hypothetical protein